MANQHSFPSLEHHSLAKAIDLIKREKQHLVVLLPALQLFRNVLAALHMSGLNRYRNTEVLLALLKLQTVLSIQPNFLHVFHPTPPSAGNLTMLILNVRTVLAAVLAHLTLPRIELGGVVPPFEPLKQILKHGTESAANVYGAMSLLVELLPPYPAAAGAAACTFWSSRFEGLGDELGKAIGMVATTASLALFEVVQECCCRLVDIGPGPAMAVVLPILANLTEYIFPPKDKDPKDAVAKPASGSSDSAKEARQIAELLRSASDDLPQSARSEGCECRLLLLCLALAQQTTGRLILCYFGIGQMLQPLCSISTSFRELAIVVALVRALTDHTEADSNSNDAVATNKPCVADSELHELVLQMWALIGRLDVSVSIFETFKRISATAGWAARLDEICANSALPSTLNVGPVEGVQVNATSTNGKTTLSKWCELLLEQLPTTAEREAYTTKEVQVVQVVGAFCECMEAIQQNADSDSAAATSEAVSVAATMGWPAGGDRKHVLERIEARLAEISHADNALVGRTHETVKRLLDVLQHSVGNSNADSVPAAAKAAQVLQPDRQLSLDDYYASRPHRPNRCIGARQSCVLLSDLEPICASLFSELLSDEVQPPLLSPRLCGGCAATGLQILWPSPPRSGRGLDLRALAVSCADGYRHLLGLQEIWVKLQKEERAAALSQARATGSS